MLSLSLFSLFQSFYLLDSEKYSEQNTTEDRVLTLVMYCGVFKVLTCTTLVQARVLLLKFQNWLFTLSDTLRISAEEKILNYLFVYAKPKNARGFFNSTVLTFTLSRPCLMYSDCKSQHSVLQHRPSFQKCLHHWSLDLTLTVIFNYLILLTNCVAHVVSSIRL